MMIMDIEFYAKKIFGFAMLKTNNFQDAEDLSQEILISLYNSSEKINKVDNVDAYVYKICAYTWSNFYRREKRHWNNVNIEVAGDISDINEIDELIEENHRQRLILILRKEIAYMTKVYREILVKSYFEKKTIKQIAEELSLAPGTVKWYIHDAKRMLREDIKMNNNTQSYRPIKMSIGHSGTPGNNNEPDSYFKSLLNQNIAYVAYKEPLTIEEISRRLEVGCAFVEEALKELEYSDLVKKVGNKYQTAFFITEASDYIPFFDLMIEKSEKIAVPVYKIIHKVVDKIKAVGFLGSELEEDVLMWTLYPYYLEQLLHKTEDFKRFSKATPPERRDGGKYIASGRVLCSEGSEGMEGKYEKIYPRYECLGFKTRNTESKMFSYQVDSFFQGVKWREFSGPDLEKLWRIGEIARYNIEPNDFEKIIISEYVQLGYLDVEDKKIKYKFPLMTKEEKETVDKIVEDEFKKIDIEEFVGGLVTQCYKLLKDRVSSIIEDNDIRYKATNNVCNIILGTMEYLERIGTLRSPTEEEKAALTTFVWKE